MSTRPPLSTRTTALSDTSHATSLFSSSYRSSGQTTAMTSPDLEPPKKGWYPGAVQGKMDQMLTVFESDEASSRRTTMAMENLSGISNDGSRRPSAGLGRGPSVKDRAKEWENTPQPQAGPSKPTTPIPIRRALPQPDFTPSSATDENRSGTAPLRVNKRPSPAPTTLTPTPAAQTRRVPVPATAPQQRTGYFYDESENVTSHSARRSPDLKRGTGSAKKMIQQWEGRPADGSPTRRRLPSTGQALQPSKRVYSQDYLDAKPLPVPSATPLPSSNYYNSPSARAYTPAQAVTPTKQHRPSPLQHLQTPSQQLSAYRSRSPTSPSQYSLSTSPSSGKLKGKSPLKDMLNKFGGGVRDVGRKMKGKSKEKFGKSRESLGGSSREDLHFWEDPRGERLGTSGLPGGIVFNDRMGDHEMVGNQKDSEIIRSSPVVYLTPTPCSSVSPWGSWLTSYATLTSAQLRITYCPVFPTAGSGNSTPRRVLSGANPSSAAYPSIPFGAIPLPASDQEPDVELNMKDCVEVRSLRREEIKGRGIPSAPEGIGTEVLEMVWNDGGKRYFGVEGVGGRLGWVSAIWDVLLACQSSNPSNLPPPSPTMSSMKQSAIRQLPQIQNISPLGSFAYPPHEPPPELTAFRNRIVSLERRSHSPEPTKMAAPPIQKVGDAWVAANVLAPSTVRIKDTIDRAPSAEDLRNSVQRMFDQPAIPLTEQITLDPPALIRSENEESDPMQRVKAWQQPDATTQHLSIFRLARGTIPPTEIGEPIAKTDTLLGFDPNDLNPSRSASQVRRQTSVLGGVEGLRKKYEAKTGLSGIEEGSDSPSFENTKPATHISHVTFPKPTMGGMRIGGYATLPQPLSPHIEAPEGNGSSTVEETYRSRSTTSGGDSVDLRTPHTTQGSETTFRSNSVTDPTVLAKLDDHSTEHTQINQQLGGVQGDLQKVIGTLTSLVAGAAGSAVIEGKLDTVALDVKAIENALNLNSLSVRVPPTLSAGEEDVSGDGKIPEVHRKLDAIAKLCEDLLARPAMGGGGVLGGVCAGAAVGVGGNMAGVGAVGMPAPSAISAPMARKGSLGLSVDATEEKEAGEEVAAIMTDLTGGSCKASPRVGGIQVLHSLSKPPSPSGETAATSTELPEDTRKQVGEVLTLVRDLKDARALQTQQTTDIARYLSELNSWLEKFVVNSTKELTGLNTRLTSLVGSDEPAGVDDSGAPLPPIGLPDLVADMHAMVSEQKRRAESEGMVGQRLDTLLQMMGEERERQATQQNTVDQVAELMAQQRQNNEILLRALATDLTSEIRGERFRFVDAMQQATSVNVNLHVEEFKKLLGAEVAKSMQELGQMREEKKALEQNISDLFALKAKHGMITKKNSKKGGITAPASPVASYGRGLPAPPPGRPH